MLLEQVYLLFIYIQFIMLAMVTVVAIALFVALVVTMGKLDNKKNTSLSDRQRCILTFKNHFQRYATFLWSLIFYNYYTQKYYKCQIFKKNFVSSQDSIFLLYRKNRLLCVNESAIALQGRALLVRVAKPPLFKEEICKIANNNL